MPCLVLVLMLAFPRVVLVGMWLFTTMLARAYDSLLIPVLGFIFLPITTVAYAVMVNAHLPPVGVNLLILLIAVILDSDQVEAVCVAAVSARKSCTLDCMKNVTLSADEHLIEQARLIAREKQTTLNQAFRDWLVEYTRRSSAEASIDALYKRLAHINAGRRFSRDELNDR